MPASNPDAPTAREREVLALISLGLTNEEIAERLGITLDGAKYHVSQILSKLGVASREEAAAAAAAKPPVRARARGRWWAALPLAAKAAGAALAVAAVAGLGVLAWGVIVTGGEAETDKADVEASSAPRLFIRVDGAAMEPTLMNGTQVEVLRYGNALPETGDLVVFSSFIPSSQRLFVKRVIAGPGDAVVVTPDGEVDLNGEVLQEPYVSSITQCSESACSWQLPAANTQASQSACAGSACYFVMGDNRQNSSDSRQGWLVRLEDIVGSVEASPTP